jgi:amidase
VCLVPFGKVDKSLDSEPVKAVSPFVPDCENSPSVEHGFLHMLERGLMQGGTDDPEVLDGAPLGIQIVAPSLRDEDCLWAAAVIDRDIRA